MRKILVAVVAAMLVACEHHPTATASPLGPSPVISPVPVTPASVNSDDAEFATRARVSRAELISAIETAVAEVESVLLNFPTAKLLVQYPVQVYQVSALQAVYHVVEHFSYHLGQILYIYKLQTETDPGFYRHLTGNP